MFERVIGVGVLVGVVYLMALAGMPHKSVQTLTPVAPLSVTFSEPHTGPVSGFGLQAAQSTVSKVQDAYNVHLQ